MEHIREALQLFAAHRRLLRYVFAPMAWSALLFLTIVLLGYLVLVPPLRNLLTGFGLGAVAGAASVILYVAVWIAISGIVFLAIVSLLSSLAWEKLSYEVEVLATGSASASSPPRSQVIADSLLRTFLTLLLAGLALVSSFVLPVIGPIALAAVAAMFDFTSAAFARRGMLLAEQRRHIRSLRGGLSFAALAGVLTLLPLVNVLMLPVLVAAGTIMVAKSRIH
jgi:uncharacterized protein involved in cysteine biosynthesis